ncbi:MAG: 1-(5-phosphoribosyl)-5-[(5-phosphoribosylamino)methylideneamino]imidazole-4-carboxamide isomerase [Halanaerobiales bacterium]
MEIIPAVDIKEGNCVRLRQGDFAKEEIFGRDPVKMALSWQESGAVRLHVVDLDGAKGGAPQNAELVKEIAKQLEIPVQTGGGIRSMDIIRDYLAAGLDRVILGTAALERPELLARAVEEYGPERIVAGVDARKGKVAVRGWLETSDQTVEETIERLSTTGINTFIYTDIARDGMLAGPDLEGLAELIEYSDINLIASGGISTISDLEKLEEMGVTGAIVGQALYSGELDSDIFACFRGE